LSFRVIIQRRAHREIDEAYEWIARDAPHRALRWVDGIQRAIATLADNPRRCPRAREAEGHPDDDVRQLVYGRRGTYRIIFLIRGETVSVLSVRHSARQPVPLEQLLGEIERE
jgi:plasmid stabilization system protein ParE